MATRNLKLENVRKEKKVTQLQLAWMTGFSLTFIQRLCSGYEAPTQRAAERLASALKCKVQDIFEEVKP